MLDVLDIHTHTTASGHAYNTIYEMAQSASRKGLALLGISDEKLLSETAAKAAEGKLTVRAVEKIAADGEKPGKMPIAHARAK